jgi:NADPH-dependent 2,4-dienoyl-CoA reductase/sulfur reductase-like enzyme
MKKVIGKIKFVSAVVCAAVSIISAQTHVASPQTTLPIAATVDILVIGANDGGIAAAIAAAKKGGSVMLISPEYYVGEQFSARLRCWIAPGETSSSSVAQSIFGAAVAGSGYRYLTPDAYKVNTEKALQNAGVHFLFKSYGVGVIIDGAGKLSGAIIANKAGRQAVVAKVVIDATRMAGFAQLAGAQMTAWGSPTIKVSRSYRPSQYQQADKADQIIESAYALSIQDIAMPGGSWVERCKAGVTHRAYSLPKMSFYYAANHCHYEEPVSIIARKEYAAATWPGAGSLDIDFFRSKNIDHLYVIGSRTGISRAHAPNLSRPLAQIDAGERVGEAAYAEAAGRATPSGIKAAVNTQGSAAAGLSIAETNQGLRPGHSYAELAAAQELVQIWATYDIVVVGGGTSGCPAAISAAKNGAKVLLIEMHGLLGGTRHGILGYYRGYTYGFNQQIEYSRKLQSVASGLYKEVTGAGVDIWYNTLGCAAITQDKTVKGVVVATPMGRGAVVAKVIIDATGDGDIATHAGAAHEYNSGDLNQFSTTYFGNTDPPLSIVNEWPSWSADPWDIYSMTWFHVLSRRRDKFQSRDNNFEFYPLCGFRGTRRIIGDYILTLADECLSRPFEDGINMCVSNYDMHGIPISEPGAYAGLMADPDVNMTFIAPYRSILPKGLNGMLMVGRCMSVTNDGLAAARMEADLINQGYAAGYIASTCAKNGAALRDVDIGAVQDHLVSIGNISSSLRSEKCKAWSVSDAQIKSAADNAGSRAHDALLLSQGQRSIPILKTSFLGNKTKAKAKILCILGDNTAVDYLAAWLDNQSLGSHAAQQCYGGKNTIGPDIVGVMWALGIPKDKRSVPALARKLNDLGAIEPGNKHFSSLRAITGALGMTGSADAVPALVSYLNKAGVRGYTKKVTDTDAHTAFEPALCEAYAAAALYRCGDNSEKLGTKILQNYANDWRGPFVRYATSVLSGEDMITAKAPLPRTVTFADPRSSVRVEPLPGRNGIRIHYSMFGDERIEAARILTVSGRELWRSSGMNLASAHGSIEWSSASVKDAISAGVIVVSVTTNTRTIGMTVCTIPVF